MNTAAGSDDESIIHVRRGKKRVQILNSDSEEDGEAERRALSPRTRKSIVGVFNRFTDDESSSSEIAYSDEEDFEREKPTKNSSVEEDDGKAEDESATEDYSKADVDAETVDDCEAEQRDLSRAEVNRNSVSAKEPSFIENSAAEVSGNSVSSKETSYNERSTALHSGNSVSSEDSSYIEQKTAEVERNSVTFIESLSKKSFIDQSVVAANTSPTFQKASNIKAPVDVQSPAFIHDNHEPRYTMNFNRSATTLLSSTICEDPEKNDKQNSIKNGSSSSHSSDDVQLISNKIEPIELSSDDEISSPVKRELVQPKIQKAFSDMPPPSSVKKTPGKGATKFVSKEFYDKEFQKLMELKQELLSAESLAETVGPKMPDGGRNLIIRCERLKLDIDIKTKLIKSFVIESEIPSTTSVATKKPVITPAANWDELSRAVNDVLPTHTGAKGMRTFNAQKALTAERLKDLHGSLETRPKEDELADNPKGLKVDLMPHQRHALLWMAWREKQNPHGGILADDMGLGKTLSMISLVLAAKNQREINGSDSEDSDNDNGAWCSKGRRTKYKGGTLVVCPASLVLQWESEVSRRVSSRRLSVLVHHGQNRDTKAKHLRTYDIVVTTYAIVSREHKTNGALFGLKWRRIILDEGHVIRNPKTQMSIAACELSGTCRWILTGTPVQNKELDVYALLKFLRCTPFDDLLYWKRWIDKTSSGQERMRAVMQTLLLRRTKAGLQVRGDLDCLPEKQLKLVEVKLSKEEMNVYQKVMVYSRTLFAQFLFQRAERNTDLNFVQDAARPSFMQAKDPNGAYYKLHQKFTSMHTHSTEVKSHEILTLLLRLRQICCHPGLIDAMLEEDEVHSSAEESSTQTEIDLLNELNKLAIKDTYDNDDNNVTPVDNALVRASAKVMQRSNPVFDLDRCSSKITEVLNTIQHIVNNSNDKAIVVSQWSSMLRIIRSQLLKLNICTVVIDGSVPVKSRQGIMDDFNNPSRSSRVMLLSLTAGGVGLNLTGANHLLMADLHWNPQLEAQAQDRIYRVGQKKTVIIYKFMCVETIEERIKALQDHKMQLANGILDGSKASKGSQLSMADLRGLFEM